MKRGVIGILASWSFASLASAAELSPADFAYGMPVVTTADASAYRAALPESVYQHVVRADLADVRVFNARGEAVPYAVSRPAGRPALRSPGTELPLFAVRSDSAAAVDAVRVTIDSPGAAVKLQTQGAAATTGAIKQYILDGRPLSAAVTALKLTWPEDAADFTGRLRVDISQDFASWRTLAEAAPIANLHANGRQLINDRIELPAAQAKYWRLSWIGRSAPFELTSVVAEPADSRIEAERSTLEFAGTPGGAARDEIQFDLGARLPVERINLGLPELNTVIAVELLSRARPQDAWRHIAARQFYRLNTADGELRSQPIDIPADSDRYWMARAVGLNGAALAAPLRLQVAWIPSDIVFLARGRGPFMLAYGSALAPAAETDLSVMPGEVAVLRATFGAPRPLGGQVRLVSPLVFPWKRGLLWAVLALGVCLLAWMAYRLSRELGENSPH